MASLSAFLFVGRGHAEVWRESGHWTITVAGSGTQAICLAVASYEDDTVIMLGPGVGDRAFDLTLVQPRWKSIEEGKEYPVEVYYDRKKIRGSMSGVVLAGNKGLSADVSSGVVRSLMTANVMSFVYKGEVVARLSLAGSANAVIELSKCQKAKNPEAWPLYNHPDPFGQ